MDEQQYIDRLSRNEISLSEVPIGLREASLDICRAPLLAAYPGASRLTQVPVTHWSGNLDLVADYIVRNMGTIGDVNRRAPHLDMVALTELCESRAQN